MKPVYLSTSHSHCHRPLSTLLGAFVDDGEWSSLCAGEFVVDILPNRNGNKLAMEFFLQVKLPALEFNRHVTNSDGCCCCLVTEATDDDESNLNSMLLPQSSVFSLQKTFLIFKIWKLGRNLVSTQITLSKTPNFGFNFFPNYFNNK